MNEQAKIVMENRKAVREFFESRPVADKLKDMVEDHINQGDTILAVISDVLEMGWRETEQDRFPAVSELLQQYRDRNRKFITKMYAFVKKAEKAA